MRAVGIRATPLVNAMSARSAGRRARHTLALSEIDKLRKDGVPIADLVRPIAHALDQQDLPKETLKKHRDLIKAAAGHRFRFFRATLPGRQYHRLTSTQLFKMNSPQISAVHGLQALLGMRHPKFSHREDDDDDEEMDPLGLMLEGKLFVEKLLEENSNMLNEPDLTKVAALTTSEGMVRTEDDYQNEIWWNKMEESEIINRIGRLCALLRAEHPVYKRPERPRGDETLGYYCALDKPPKWGFHMFKAELSHETGLIHRYHELPLWPEAARPGVRPPTPGDALRSDLLKANKHTTYERSDLFPQGLLHLMSHPIDAKSLPLSKSAHKNELFDALIALYKKRMVRPDHGPEAGLRQDLYEAYKTQKVYALELYGMKVNEKLRKTSGGGGSSAKRKPGYAGDGARHRCAASALLDEANLGRLGKCESDAERLHVPFFVSSPDFLAWEKPEVIKNRQVAPNKSEAPPLFRSEAPQGFHKPPAFVDIAELKMTTKVSEKALKKNTAGWRRYALKLPNPVIPTWVKEDMHNRHFCQKAPLSIEELSRLWNLSPLTVEGCIKLFSFREALNVHHPMVYSAEYFREADLEVSRKHGEAYPRGGRGPAVRGDERSHFKRVTVKHKGVFEHDVDPSSNTLEEEDAPIIPDDAPPRWVALEDERGFVPDWAVAVSTEKGTKKVDFDTWTHVESPKFKHDTTRTHTSDGRFHFLDTSSSPKHPVPNATYKKHEFPAEKQLEMLRRFDKQQKKEKLEAKRNAKMRQETHNKIFNIETDSIKLREKFYKEKSLLEEGERKAREEWEALENARRASSGEKVSQLSIAKW